MPVPRVAVPVVAGHWSKLYSVISQDRDAAMKLTLMTMMVLMLGMGWTSSVMAGGASIGERMQLILQEHVNEKGMVNYDALKSNETRVDTLYKQMSSVDQESFDRWSKDKQLAFLMDVYNLYTLKLILKHHPVESISKIKPEWKIWDQKEWKLLGNTVSLNDIEHKIIRPDYKEPRIHFTLVCAAISCPPLQNYSYMWIAERNKDLGKAMDEPTREFLANPGSFRIDQKGNKVYVSKLLEWYGDDFKEKFTPKSGYAGSDKQKAVIDFFAQYLDQSDAAWLKKGGYEIVWLEYDWKLNKQ